MKQDKGCIKADAMLSQGEAVLSVPSVTLWEAPELEAFAERFLKERTVFIVVDADALVKGEVMTQAKLCLSFLRRRAASRARISHVRVSHVVSHAYENALTG